ncbi:uncharacterized protein [Amphiura filiformis]|uniref:uncharacterized protein n=1 Tax=Amphiura filiformis TaxID=82378 RepID=UPI003B218396
MSQLHNVDHIKDQSIPPTIQQEALKPLVDDMVLKSLQDKEVLKPIVDDMVLKSLQDNMDKLSITPGYKHSTPSHITAILQSFQNLYSTQHEAQRRLAENCRRAGFRFHGNIPADGNCFFHAVSDQLSLLGLPIQTAAQLRHQVVTYLRNHPQIQGPDGIIDVPSYIESDWTSYLESMTRDGEWADAVILVAMSHMLRRGIMVVTSSPEGTEYQACHIVYDINNTDLIPIRLGHVCELHYMSLEPIPSTSIPDDSELQTLQVQNQDQYKLQGEPADPQLWPKKLKDIYRSRRRGIGFLPGFPKEFPSDEFFVDLHLVKEQKLPTKVRHVELNTYADLINLQDLSGQSINHVVVSGLGGTGKSTMVSRLAYQWANVDKKPNEKSLFKFDLVFLLDIRKFEPEMDLADAIKSQLLTHVPKQHIETYLSANADKCMYLFDGYDELSAGFRVLQSDLLCGSLVIVTTRPHKVDQFYDAHKEFMYVQVLLNGFSDRSVQQFVERYFGDEEDKQRKQNLQDIIRRNNELRDLSHFPLLLGMICLIWQDKDELPKTISGLYQQVLEFSARHWKAREPHFESLSFLEFKDQVELNQTMLLIGKTAFQGLTDNSRLIFQEDEFDSQQIVEHGCSLGFMSSESKVSGFDKIKYVSFIHKTFQEYCAALYLSSLADTDVNLLQSHLYQMDIDDMEYVVRFCCGTSQKTAEFILTHVVQLTNVSSKIESKSTRFERDSCRLPLILLFESESTFGVQNTLHSILRPSVSNIIMYVNGYRRADPVYFAALQYLVNVFETQHEWTTHVKMATIMCDLSTSVTGLCEKQLELLNKMLHIKKLTIGVSKYRFDSEFHNVTKQINRLIDSLEELTLLEKLGEELSVSTISTVLHQIPHHIRPHFDSMEVNKKTNQEIFADVLQTIHSRSGSIRVLKAEHCDMGKVIRYVTPFYSSLEKVKFMYVDLPQAGVDTMFEDMIKAGKMLNSHDSMSNDHEDKTSDNIASQQTVHLPLQELEELYRVSSVANSVSKLCAATVFLGSLKKLRLSVCKLSEEMFQELGQVLTNLTSLQHLDLGCNTIGKSLKAVIQGINGSKIKSLNLCYSKLTKESNSALSLLQLPFLEDLNLSFNDIDSRGADFLAESLKHAPKLKFLNLNYNVLGSQGVVALCKSLQYVTHLETLKLSGNKIGSDGMMALCETFHYITHLKILELDDNNIGSDSTKALAAVLQYIPNLHELYLTKCQIKSDGAKALASALQYIPIIHNIYLSDNQIQSDGAKALASALQYTPNLRELYLAHNQIQSDGVEALQSALPHNTYVAGSWKTQKLPL